MDDTVTELREVPRGYRVVINANTVLYLSKADFRALPLREGETLDLDAYRQNLLLRQYPEALPRAVRLLAVRARSRQEIERKLADAGYLPETIEMVLYKLEKETLLDDAAFAETWVENRLSSGIGMARLTQELRQKGVARDVTEAVIGALDTDSVQAQAKLLAAKLLRRHRALPQAEATQKVLAAMMRRGFGYGDAKEALRAAREESAEDSP